MIVCARRREVQVPSSKKGDKRNSHTPVENHTGDLFLNLEALEHVGELGAELLHLLLSAPESDDQLDR